MELRGNKWYKCDLHIHTPESKCFSDKDISAEEWVRECINKGLDVVAVTDHNSGNYVDNIKEAAEGTGLIVFPGVEITCDTSKVHLLILFDRTKGTKDINEFLIYCGINSEDFAKQEAMTNENYGIFQVAEEAIKRGALVIPAHIDEYNGISVTSNKSMNDFLSMHYINGVQVVNKEMYFNKQYTRDEMRTALVERYPKLSDDLMKTWLNAVKKSIELEKSVLTFSDNPSAPKETTHGLWGIGKRYTWIKMDENVSLESLRQALIMPDQRIRNDFNNLAKPYTQPDFLIKGLLLKKTTLNNKDINISFNPQLNT
ncbi:PHP domain-containing protein, partial [Peribacillus frigoritolerans]|uniref:PHP domain-containing protein n=1 Tax=Peribacillus frigoritolerans TaxID=450367 RepID=UPI001E5E4382